MWLLIVQQYKKILSIASILGVILIYVYVKTLQLTIREQSITISQLITEKDKLMVSYNSQKKDFQQVEKQLKTIKQQTHTKIIKIQETNVSPICEESIKYLKPLS